MTLLALWDGVFSRCHAWYKNRHCGHSRIPMRGEGKVHCPECGQGLILQWWILKCPDCGRRRASQYRYGSLAPLYRFCDCCGGERILKERLISPSYYQLRQALLMIEDEHHFTPEISGWLERTFVWLAENEQGSPLFSRRF